MTFPEPTDPVEDERQVLLRYLDFYRDVLCSKVGGMTVAEQTTSRLPSGWTPLELITHLRHVERRWLEWGFAGEPITDPWADRRGDRWYTDEDFDALAAALAGQAGVSRRVVEAHGLDDLGRPSERWAGADPPPLRRVLLHVLQEYARHCGHIDIVRELADGSTGEGAG
jgi:hypothetical protein